MRTNRSLAAVLATAVLLIGLAMPGCVTKRDIEGLQEQLDRVEQQTRTTQQMVNRMDTTVAADADANRTLRADIQSSLDQVQQQLDQLLENYNQLNRDLRRTQQPRFTPPTSSPGADTTGTGTTGTTQTAVPNADCDRQFDDAFLLVQKGNYDKAIQGFRDYLANCPRHSSVASAHYWIGECYYSLERYNDAVTEFDYMLKNYRSSPKACPAMYKVGRCYQELNKKADARKAFQQVIDNCKTGIEAEQARDRLKELR